MTHSEKNHNKYSLGKQDKDILLTDQLKALCRHHIERCPEYARMMRAVGFDADMISDYRQIPPLPVGLFKEMLLSSIDSDNLKTLTSSGTSGQAVSRIILDGETRTAQQIALAQIGTDFLGEARLPMLVIDCEGTVKKKERFSARAAGIQGFSLFGAHRTFALREDLSLDTAKIEEFLRKYGNSPFLIFGFTYIIYEYLIKACRAEDIAQGTAGGYDMSNGILIHGGGWKKLQDLQISEETFRAALKEQFGITKVHDYYGMAEQAGSIFMECEEGHMHCSDYSGIVIRRSRDMSACAIGEKGIIEVFSVLPKSYPGHALLTEDEGIMLGEDDCPCGRKGAYFKVLGRIAHAQIRGCSDTYEKL